MKRIISEITRTLLTMSMLTLAFSTLCSFGFFSVVEASEFGNEVKFRGIVISDEKWGEIVAYGSYYCEVTVLEVLYDPSSTLSLNDNVTVAYQESLSLCIGDEVECYGINCINCSTCPKQCYGYIVCKPWPWNPTPYYVVPWTPTAPKLLLETDKRIYNLGENVTITLTNISNETIEIGGYPAWQIFTYPGEEPVYPRIFAFLAWSLDPGESDTFIWNQYNEFNESFCEPGTYVVKDTQGWSLSTYFKIVGTTIDPIVNIHLQALNLRSKDEWITAYIEPPEGYDVAEINVSTLMLNGTIPAELAPIAIGDYDNDNFPDLMVKFDRAKVIQYILSNVDIIQLIEKRFMTITLTITGCLNDRTLFQGSDTIKIIYTIPRFGRYEVIPF